MCLLCSAPVPLSSLDALFFTKVFLCNDLSNILFYSYSHVNMSFSVRPKAEATFLCTYLITSNPVTDESSKF